MSNTVGLIFNAWRYAGAMGEKSERKRAPPTSDMQAIGKRLKALRELKGLTQDQAGAAFHVGKSLVSAWEKGTDPGAVRLKEIARFYDVSVDAILWENPVTQEAMGFAAKYDALNERQKRNLDVLWQAFITIATDDSDVEAAMPEVKERAEKIRLSHAEQDQQLAEKKR